MYSTDRRRRRRAPGGRGNKIYKYPGSSGPARPGGDRGAGWLRRCRPASGRRRCWQQQKVPECETFRKKPPVQERPGQSRSQTIFHHLWSPAVWCWPELAVFCLQFSLKSFSLLVRRNILPLRWVLGPKYPTAPSAGWRYWGPEIARTGPVTHQMDHLTIEYNM